ncbi:MAG TPA: hypothetical protein VG870_13345, partial [Chitinophagaceae bacterium]|nr:hypothetical protein [Chitinophagaceae bacterium]
MLQQLLYFLYCSLVCLAWGLPVVQLGKTGQAAKPRPGPLDLILGFFCGLALTSLLAALLSLVFPLRPYLLGALTLVPAAWTVAGWGKAVRSDAPPARHFTVPVTALGYLGFLGLVAALLFTLASRPPVMEDMDLYHLQIIRWNQEFGTVPGLANLYLRYGFYSNWLYDVAFFALPFRQENFLYLNLTLAIWFTGFLLNRLHAYMQLPPTRQHRFLAGLALLVLLFCLAEWKLIRGSSRSTSYDFAVAVFALVFLLLATESLLQPGSRRPAALPAMLLLAAAAP